MNTAMPLELAAVAARQHGLFTTRQAEPFEGHPADWGTPIAAGIWQTADADSDYEVMLDAATLLEIDPTGAIFDPTAPAPFVVSHRWAAAMWGANWQVAEYTITAPAGFETAVGNVAVTVGALPPSDVTRRNGIPVTTPARTYRDMAAVTGDAVNMGRWVADMIAAGLVTIDELLVVHPPSAVCASPAEFLAVFDADVANW